MDLSLLDEEKIPPEQQRPCSMTKNGIYHEVIVVAEEVKPYLFKELIILASRK